jgi:hypothetical protein
MFTVTGHKSGRQFVVSSLEEMQELLHSGELDRSNCPAPPLPATVYAPGWANQFPPHGDKFPPFHLKKTSPFCAVYADVTTAIRTYYATDKQSELFLEFMIEKFYEEYTHWGAKGSFPQSYLSTWHQKSNAPAYCLIGQAYLHIAWDLPRVVVDCFPFGMMGQLRISEADASEHFLQTNTLFQKVFNDNVRKYEVAGMLCWPGKLLGQDAAIVRLGTHWIIAVRMTAWVLGCCLAKQTPVRQAELLNKLRLSVQSEALKAIGGKFNMVGWMGLITQPSFMFSFAGLALLAPLAELTRLTLAVRALVAALCALLVWIAYQFGVYRGTVNIAKNLGGSLQRALEELIAEARSTEKREFE